MNTDQPIEDGSFDLIEIQPGSMADEAAHERGLQEDPRSFGGRFQLGLCLHQVNRLSEAERQFRKLTPHSASHFRSVARSATFSVSLSRAHVRSTKPSCTRGLHASSGSPPPQQEDGSVLETKSLGERALEPFGFLGLVESFVLGDQILARGF
jgi:hypothetical protein